MATTAMVVRKKRKPAKLATSAAVMAAGLKKRVLLPTMVKGAELASTIVVIPPKDFKRLHVDESYQRVRITDHVNDLIHVIRGGGQIADPIDVVQRTDGTWWIVDGQQRFWAHSECQVPMRAHIHKVENLDEEKRLFLVLNARRKVGTRVMVKGWTGPVGETIRRLNTDPRSPLCGLIDLTGNTHQPIDATAMVRAILALTTGMLPKGDMARSVLPRADLGLKVVGMTAWVDAFAQLMAAVFEVSKGSKRVRILPLIALARVAHRKYVEAGRPVFPRTTATLRRANWDTMVPTHAQRYIPILESEMERRWGAA